MYNLILESVYNLALSVHTYVIYKAIHAFAKMYVHYNADKSRGKRDDYSTRSNLWRCNYLKTMKLGLFFVPFSGLNVQLQPVMGNVSIF